MIHLEIDWATNKGNREGNEDYFGFAFQRMSLGRTFDAYFKSNETGLEIKTLFYVNGDNLLIGKMEMMGLELNLDSLWCFMLADGLGGHQAGEVASEWACKGFLSNFMDRFIASGDIKAAINEGYRGAEEMVGSKAPRGAASTLAVAVAHKGNLHIANIGDSRAYVFQDGKLRSRTKDHSVVQSLIDAGAIDEAESLRHPQRNIITKAVGNSPGPPDIIDIGNEWDNFLLCSDGVWGLFVEWELVRMSEKHSTANEFVRIALERGGDDNATALTVYKH